MPEFPGFRISGFHPVGTGYPQCSPSVFGNAGHKIRTDTVGRVGVKVLKSVCLAVKEVQATAHGAYPKVTPAILVYRVYLIICQAARIIRVVRVADKALSVKFV